MCGDSTDSDVVELLLNGEKAEFGFTSPPYNLGKSVGLRNGAFKGKSNAYETHDDEMCGSEYLDLLKSSISNSIKFSECQAVNIQCLLEIKKSVLNG